MNSNGSFTFLQSSNETFKIEDARCRIAKRKKFCRDLENISYTSKLRKVLSEDPDVSKFLMKSNGSFMESSNESLEILKTTDFPVSKDKSKLDDFSATSFNLSELINEEK